MSVRLPEEAWSSHDDSADISSTDITGSSQVGVAVINLYLYEFCLMYFYLYLAGFCREALLTLIEGTPQCQILHSYM